MINPDFSSDFERSECTSVNRFLLEKLPKVKKYLSQKVDEDREYITLLQDLEESFLKTNNNLIQVKIAGCQEDLLKKVKLFNQTCSRLNPISQFTIITFPYDLGHLFNSCDLLFLVIDSSKDSIPVEQKLVIKAKKINIPLIIFDFNQSSNKIQSWLPNISFLRVNYFNFYGEFTEKSQTLLNSREYDNCLKSLLEQIILIRQASLEEKLVKMAQKYFLQRKSQYKKQIEQSKQVYFAGEDPPQVRKKIKQLPPKLNKILQYHLKTIKQTLLDSKQDFINPFISTSFIYNVQQIIGKSTVIQFQEDKKIYLTLVIQEDQYVKAIHRHILELYQQKINLWIEQQWWFLDQELNIFNQFIEESDRELQIVNRLSEKNCKLPRISQPEFDLNKYICPVVLSETNRILFDYHYTQSNWFRIAITLSIGLGFFFLTGRLFGFVFLILQIIKVLTGQSVKSLKLKQQTKELKKSVGNKYQNLVKFIADKLMQDINIFLDEQHQMHQEKVNSYIQDSNSHLVKVKQGIGLNKNKIKQLNEDHEYLMQIMKG
ncbi:hypothetical protein Xen7305DRAFT_00022610 [Xenococcus sp. PCC 7305]|uniref:hypothetical protein n=1 Tax=Xenococcus sp. PCC 7305 TaxID=102125 RepID=UPI0002ABECD1|nr:hypothetical protein [Xenococcus sp. PCC 7305]ELS02547.1 hypothetical protein Xen7305DRAFT_00022610 [Xenococcus sp. PCC 7305]